LVPPIIDFDRTAVEIQSAVGICEYFGGKGVSWVAGYIIREHEDYIRVWDPESLDGPVHPQGVCHVLGRSIQNSEVIYIVLDVWRPTL
jgi:hypothetical protein